MAKQKSNQTQTEDLAQQLGEAIIDLQRTRADFENYRKNSEAAAQRKADVVKNTTLMRIVPMVDDIERATSHLPAELSNNEWAKGVVALRDKLLKDLGELGVERINAQPGTAFNPNYHEAVSMADGDGQQEIIAEELRSGWAINGEVVQPAMVKVVKK
jgi:molecular chaperone GrpE